MSTLALSERDTITDAAFRPGWQWRFSARVHDCASPVTILSRWPSSLRKSLDFGPMVLQVSRANEVRASQLAQASERVGSPIPASQQG